MENFGEVLVLLIAGATVGIFLARLFTALTTPGLTFEERVSQLEKEVKQMSTNQEIISRLENAYDKQPQGSLTKTIVDAAYIGAEAIAKLDLPGVDPLAESVVEFVLEIKDGQALVKKAKVKSGEVEKELQPE